MKELHWGKVRRRNQSHVTRQKRSVEASGERDVAGVGERDVVAHCPRFCGEAAYGGSSQAPPGESLEGCSYVRR